MKENLIWDVGGSASVYYTALCKQTFSLNPPKPLYMFIVYIIYNYYSIETFWY